MVKQNPEHQSNLPVPRAPRFRVHHDGLINDIPHVAKKRLKDPSEYTFPTVLRQPLAEHQRASRRDQQSQGTQHNPRLTGIRVFKLIPDLLAEVGVHPL